MIPAATKLDAGIAAKKPLLVAGIINLSMLIEHKYKNAHYNQTR